MAPDADDLVLAPHSPTTPADRSPTSRWSTASTQSLALYSGGLGVLSGDHCKSASDLGLPFVAVGLLVSTRLLPPDRRLRRPPAAHAIRSTTSTACRCGRRRAHTGREVTVRVDPRCRCPDAASTWSRPRSGWRRWAGCRSCSSTPTCRRTTRRTGRSPTSSTSRAARCGSRRRSLLGVGGVRALRALGIEPAVWHLNEGHSAILQLERLREARGGARRVASGAARDDRRATRVHHPHSGAGRQRAVRGRRWRASTWRRWPRALGVASSDLLALGNADHGEPGAELQPDGPGAAPVALRQRRLEAQRRGHQPSMWWHLLPPAARRPRDIRADHQRRPHRDLARRAECSICSNARWARDWRELAARPGGLARRRSTTCPTTSSGRRTSSSPNASADSCARACASSSPGTAARPTSCARVERPLRRPTR